MPRQNIGLMERFIGKVKVVENGCWEWQGARGKDGYGHFYYEGSDILAHRFAVLACHGDLKPDHDVHHLCDNPPCVNPSHLEQLTRIQHLRSTPRTASYHALRNNTCRNGHIFDAGNTLVRPNGTRWCKQCGRDKNKRRWHSAPKKKSQYRGVLYDGPRQLWRASISVQGKMYFLGNFSDEPEAAYVYDQVALQIYGDKARPNLL